MDKKIGRLLLIIITGILIISCNNNKEKLAPANEMRYQDKTYDLAHGFCSTVKDSVELKGITISLYSSSLKVKYKDGKPALNGGTINGLSFYFALKRGTKELYPGEYICSINNDLVPGNFIGSVLINIDATKGGYIDNYLKLGKVRVKKKNNIYEISFDCVDSNRDIVKGFYKGELIEAD